MVQNKHAKSENSTEVDQLALPCVRILYTNWKGRTEWRLVQPIRTYSGSTNFHPGLHALMEAIDMKDGSRKTFALKDVKEWKHVSECEQ